MSLAKINHSKVFVRKKIIQNTLLTVFFILLAVAVYFLLDNGNKTAWVFVCGISAVFSAAVIPHYISVYMTLNARIRTMTETFVVKDSTGKVLDSYSSLDEMMKQNPKLFKPQCKTTRYTVEDIETQTIVGEIHHEETHIWKPKK